MINTNLERYRVYMQLHKDNDGQLAGHEHIELYSEELTFQDANDYIFNAWKTYSRHTVGQVRMVLVNGDEDHNSSVISTGQYH